MKARGIAVGVVGSDSIVDRLTMDTMFLHSFDFSRSFCFVIKEIHFTNNSYNYIYVLKIT